MTAFFIHVFMQIFKNNIDIRARKRYNNKKYSMLCSPRRTEGTIMALNRREAREAVFELLFETEFKNDEPREEIFALSTNHREIEENDYVRNA